jgi:hypothetical protein
MFENPHAGASRHSMMFDIAMYTNASECLGERS